ncbi:MAG: RDD family protein [Flavobacterium sp.]
MKLLKFLMFNRLVKNNLNNTHSYLEWNKRIKSTALEGSYTASIFIPFGIILMVPFTILLVCLGDAFMINFSWLILVPVNLIMAALINKDIFGGQSVVHRILGYQVVDVKTNKPASKLKCMLRNVTAPLWIIEGVFLLVNPKRRLGDFIAGTSLIEVEASDPELILTEIKNAKFDKETKVALLVSVIWLIAFMLLFDPRMRIL